MKKVYALNTTSMTTGRKPTTKDRDHSFSYFATVTYTKAKHGRNAQNLAGLATLKRELLRMVAEIEDEERSRADSNVILKSNTYKTEMGGRV